MSISLHVILCVFVCVTKKIEFKLAVKGFPQDNQKDNDASLLYPIPFT